MTHTYPLTSLYGDYLRALIGIGFMGTPFYFTLGSTVLTVIFGGLTLLFVVFGIRTGIRQLTVIETTPAAIVAKGPFGKEIAWREVDRVDLKYFSTTREKRAGKGWMQLKICHGPACLQMESNLEGFEHVVTKAATAGFHNSAKMNETTVENFTAMGITVDMPEEDAV